MNHMHHDMDMTTQGHHMHNMTGMTGMTGDMDMGDMDMMKMYFHMDFKGETVLFHGWKIHDVGSLIVSMIGVFLFALLYEALKFGRQWLAEYVATNQTSRFGDFEAKSALTRRTNTFLGSTPFTFWHLLQTFLHMLQTFVSYLLMLIFMTYNGYLCIAVIAGAGLGYFAFGWRSKIVVEVTDHCH